MEAQRKNAPKPRVSARISQKSSGEYDFFKHICQATRRQQWTNIGDLFCKLRLKLDAKPSIRHHTKKKFTQISAPHLALHLRQNQPIDEMRIPSSRLGFDIDGVVADTTEAFIRLAREEYSITVLPEELTDFTVEDCLSMPTEIINEIFERLLNAPLEIDLRPTPDSMAVLRDLAKIGPLTFITARPASKPIAAWLEKHLGSKAFASARLVATGDHNGKATHIKQLGLSYFIDDRHLTCDQLAAEPGITPIVYNQPWNRGRHTHSCVENWTEIRNLCIP